MHWLSSFLCLSLKEWVRVNKAVNWFVLTESLVGPSDHAKLYDRLPVNQQPCSESFCAFVLLKWQLKRRQGQISESGSEFIIEFGSLASGRGGKWKLEKVNKWEQKWTERRAKAGRRGCSSPSCFPLTHSVTIETFSSLNLISLSTLSISFLSIIYKCLHRAQAIIEILPILMKERKRAWGTNGCGGEKREKSQKSSRQVPTSANIAFILFIFSTLCPCVSDFTPSSKTHYCGLWKSSMAKAMLSCEILPVCLCLHVGVNLLDQRIRGIWESPRHARNTLSGCVGVYLCRTPSVHPNRRDKGLTVVYLHRTNNKHKRMKRKLQHSQTHSFVVASHVAGKWNPPDKKANMNLKQRIMWNWTVLD